MGQKVNPIGFRVGIMEGWKSRWYASKQEFSSLLLEDLKLRKFHQREVPLRRNSQGGNRANA